MAMNAIHESGGQDDHNPSRSGQLSDQARGTGLVASLNAAFPLLTLNERMALVAERFSQSVFTTSLGKEDQLLTAAIAESRSVAANDISIVTLQTGRLFPETVVLIEETRSHFGLEIREYHPQTSSVDRFIESHGLNGFYDSVEARHACCHIRKIEPLKRALHGADAWITGLRREQSFNRAEQPFAVWDKANRLVKINPLADFTSDDLEREIAERGVPVNPLHAKGFPSIGCEPCTRAVKPGEDERAGRWWWERDDSRECGLHVDQVSVGQSEGAGQ